MPQKIGQRTGCVKVVNLGDLKNRSFAEAAAEAGYQATITVAQPGGSPVTFCEINVVKEGVWNGTFESADVLNTAATSILGKYVMLGHPKADTEPGWPEQALGQVIGYNVEDGKVKTLATMWDNRVPPELLQRLKSGETLGVSSGHVSFESPKPGEFNGKPYEFTTDKMYFEHVAIVPLGACSIEDGCEAHVVSQSPDSNLEGNAMTGNEGKGGGSDETKKVTQAAGAVSVADEVPETPPPLFKSPDEITAFVAEALQNENAELREQQIKTAFDFAMNTVSEKGWKIFDIEDPVSRSTAMAGFVTKAASAWASGDEMFTPIGLENVTAESKNAGVTGVTQEQKGQKAEPKSQSKKSWRDAGREVVKVAQSKNEGSGKITFSYPVLSKTDEGKTQISWNSTEVETDAKKGLDTFNSQIEELQTSTAKSIATLQAQVDSGKAAEDVARGMLLDSLKKAMPKLTDTSVERYKTMPLKDLSGLVSDLGQSVPDFGAAAPVAEGSGVVAEAAEAAGAVEVAGVVARAQSPTPVGLQRMSGSGKSGKMTFADARKRLKKEMGITI